MKCYELKKCPFTLIDHGLAECPAYRYQISCWEYNWVEMYNQLPDNANSVKWMEMMIKGCKSCSVYKENKEKFTFLNEFENMLKKITQY